MSVDDGVLGEPFGDDLELVAVGVQGNESDVLRFLDGLLLLFEQGQIRFCEVQPEPLGGDPCQGALNQAVGNCVSACQAWRSVANRWTVRSLVRIPAPESRAAELAPAGEVGSTV